MEQNKVAAPPEDYAARKGRGTLIPGYTKPANVEQYKPPAELVNDRVMSTPEQEHQKAMANFENGLTREQQEAWAEVEKAMREGVEAGTVRMMGHPKPRKPDSKLTQNVFGRKASRHR
jgi:hypothetical protein